MKKISNIKRIYKRRHASKIRSKQLRLTGEKRHLKLKQKYSTISVEQTRINIFRNARSKFQKKFYLPVKYRLPAVTIDLKGELGIESDFNNFILFAESFVSLKSKKIHFNFKEATRIWPSAITLFCSHEQWTDITSRNGFKPILGSIDSKQIDVNSYLAHSGFYNYVGRINNYINTEKYNDNEVVKIIRENKPEFIDEREDQVYSILNQFSSLNEEQLEDFDCNVLIEAFNNVNEHGFNYKDNGWWTLTQYHKTTGIISLCLADNGIGIKNTLLTGPQGSALSKVLGQINDGEYIKAALEENVSGALTASTKDTIELKFLKKYIRGSRRGNGLNRIKKTCQRCGVEFSLISQKGYLRIGANGKILNSGTSAKKIFAGTLYHFLIPAQKTKKGIMDGYN